MSEAGEWLRQPRERFQTYRRTLDTRRHPYDLLVAGAEMSDTARGYLHARLGSLTRKSHGIELAGLPRRGLSGWCR
jgi:hypothetical protein